MVMKKHVSVLLLLSCLLIGAVVGEEQLLEEEEFEQETADKPLLRKQYQRRLGKKSKKSSLPDPKTVQLKSSSASSNDGTNTRAFVKYVSSEWEETWLENVDEWAESQQICEKLMKKSQMKYVHDFLNLTCSMRFFPPYEDWCIIDDEFVPLFYNGGNRDEYEISWTKDIVPTDAVLDTTKRPVIPNEDHEHIVSKLVFRDETTGEKYTEYIEPLVSHLRFPLAHCVAGAPDDDKYRFHPIMFRGWIIPPPPNSRPKRKLYFDAGASSWMNGAGGPSLDYFVKIWGRSGHEFDEIFAFEMETSEKKFMKSVPDEFLETTHYQQCQVSSSPEENSEEHPFLPLFIKNNRQNGDYVLFKIDIDSPGVENGNIEFILNDPDPRIDELVWEHHVSGNYLMEEWGDPRALDQMSLRQSYDFFLRMRQKGIRAHSWV